MNSHPSARTSAVSVHASATGHPLATNEALRTLENGGNAADAVVAASFLLFVLMPEACGLGGDAFALLSTPSATVAINGSGKVPVAWLGNLPSSGAGLETVPGAVDALFRIHAHHGRLRWPNLLEPAINIAENGMLVSAELRAALKRRAGILNQQAGTWSLLTSHHCEGLLVRQPELADTLRRIAAGGAEDFYRGSLAQSLVRAAQRAGSHMATTDLASHSTMVADPVRVHVGDAVIEAQPPVSQAVIVPFALSTTADESAQPPERTHLLIEAMEEGFQWRPTLTSPEAVEVLPWTWRPSGGPARRRGGARGTSHTTSVVVSDDEGTTITALLSVFHEFGSGFLVPGLGFFLNDRMSSLADSLRPLVLDRPVHTLSPVFVRTPEDRFGIATPGADAQVQVLTQVLDGRLNEGLDWNAALARPRWRLQGPHLVVEDNLDPLLRTYLVSQGHDLVTVSPQDRSMGAITLAGHRLVKDSITQWAAFAHADRRRGSNSAIASHDITDTSE